jgi:hypothetical protein
MIQSKVFKLPILKKASLGVSNLRDLIVIGGFVEDETSLYCRLGKKDGILKILDHVFMKIT